MEFTSSRNQQQILSKIATNDGHGEASPYFDGWKAYDSDPYHPIENPDGVIQMGLAENQLCFDLIQDWVINHPEASICTAEGAKNLMQIAIYQDYHGLPAFRTAVARFMEKVRGDRVRFDPSRIVMSGGATGAHETVAFCLADPGDAFLVPTPYYPAYDRDLTWRTGVKLLPIVSDSTNGFKVTTESMEDAYQKAQAANIRVKGFLLNNPSNPLGTVLDRETLRNIVKFINDKNIHLVCDEIYSATVFSEPGFVSISEVIEEDDIVCNTDLIHIGYSLSKDLGFPGFRVGIVYSYNDAVVSCARKMSSFGLVSTQTQHLVASILSDEKFVDKFLAKSSERLAQRHETFTRGLAQLEIGTLKGNAGLYFWMDLKKLLRAATVEAEMELWRVIIHEVKLNVSPGSSFHCSEPGWFRVCFANMDDETVRVALRRIQKFVILHNKGPSEASSSTPKSKNNCRSSKLKLSLSFRRLEDRMAQQYIMSPHSPMASPLVRAT